MLFTKTNQYLSPFPQRTRTVKSLLTILSFLLLLTPSARAQTDTLTVLFETGEAHLSPLAQQQLTSLAERLDTMYKATYLLRGYTDDVGSNTANKRLAARRVEAVRLFLMARGAEDHQLESAVGVGELALSSPADTTDRTTNRRVDVVYTFREAPSEMEKLMDNAKVGETLTLPNILFEGGRSTIRQISYPNVRLLRDYLLENPSVKIHIIGHICCWPPDGTDAADLDTGIYNLSEARAKKIVDYLIRQGVDASRLTYEGKQATQPLGLGDSQDRRVEAQVVSK